jgi:uncharacterized protein
MNRIITILIISLVILLIDWYSFQAILVLMQNSSYNVKRIVTIAFWSLTVLVLFFIIAIATGNFYDLPTWFRSYVFATVIGFYLSKILLVLFLFIDDVIRLIRFVAQKISPTSFNSAKGISRSRFLVYAGLLTSGFLFASFIHGFFNMYNYQFRKIRLKIKNLPADFNGLKVVQISDIHSGTFNETKPLIDVVNRINAENADIIFFTGDLVNNISTEMLPYVDIFKQLKAKYGVYSTLGNHDYGDYYSWPTPEAKHENMLLLYNIHKRLGWHLLRNENVLLGKAGAQLAIIGVENWSALARFPKYGDLKKAYEGAENAKAKILLSHDPTHWDAQVRPEYSDIALTLSGHTHGFQFGFEYKNFKWSPVEYVYKQWAGLYQQGEQYLYVNRGFGAIGYPGRVGILPEITTFELYNEA